MSNKSQVVELEDEQDLIPQRTFITNRKTQLILNIVLIIIIVVLVVLINKKEDEIERNREEMPHWATDIETQTTTIIEQFNTRSDSTISIDTMTTISIQFISHEDWFGAKSICNTTLELIHPTQNIVIAHTATNECLNYTACINCVRFIQNAHQDDKLCDIKYNFLVGGDGRIYFGRGWDTQDALSKNNDAISIAFIGHFEYAVPNRLQIDVAQRLIAFGVQIQKIDTNYIVFPEKYFANTESPGKEVVRIIKKWPHYCNP